MKQAFVNTENVKRLQDALTALEQRGASEACWSIVDGIPGLGKTTATQRLAVRMSNVFIRSRTDMTPQWLLADLLKSMGITEPEHSYKKRFEQTISTLARFKMNADDRKERFAIFIDEADAISRSGKLMETLRDITDLLEVTTVLVGMGKLRANLTRFPQIASRVGQVVEFQPLPLSDIKKLFDARCEVEVDEGLIKQVATLSRGIAREALEGIAAIERFAAVNPKDSAITVQDMVGHVIMKDRATNTELKVMEVAA